MSEKPRVYKNFCLRCGGILISPKSIARGYGQTCWKIMRPKPIKPYVQEVPYVEIGDRYYRMRTYSSLGDAF
jgi:hypothetical protein